MQQKPNEIINLEDLYNIKIDELFGGNPMQMGDRNTFQRDKLGNIIALNLSQNQILKIQGLGFFTDLQYLFLNYNRIVEIEGLDSLSKLRVLNVDGNKITKIGGLDNLKDLRQLSLANNLIEKIEGLNNLTKLCELSLEGNSISRIEGIDNLSILRTLDLSDNQINSIENLVHLKKLRFLYLSNNCILDGYQILGDLSGLKYLSIEKNPFIKNISNFLLKEGENHLYALRGKLKLSGKITVTLPAKVLLLGNHSSGKSTFANYFLMQNDNNRIIQPTETTHILNILNLYTTDKKEGLPTAKIYDFGGQDYYHGIYKVFLTTDSINVVFWHKQSNCNQVRVDSKKQRTQDFNREYWIYQLIHYYQKERGIDDESPNLHEFFLVQTHADDGDRKEVVFANNTKLYYIENEFFIGLSNEFLSTSIGRLSYAILEASIMNEIRSKQRTVEVSQAYMEFLEYINNYEESAKVSVTTLKRKFPELTLTDKEFQEELNQLCRHGLVLYYPHNDVLKNVVWLNPGKTVEEIHHILSRKYLHTNGGIISKKSFDKDINGEIVELLKENKVIYLDETDEKHPKYIIPGFLPLAKNKVDEFFLLSDFEKTNYILKFEHFIPFGFINQLICHYGKNPETKLFWRDRLLFTTKDRQARVLLNLDFKTQKISVYIKSKKEIVHVKRIEREILDDIIKIYWDENPDTITPSDDNLLFSQETKRKPIDDLFISTDGVFFIKLGEIDSCVDPNDVVGYPLTDEGTIDIARGKRVSLNSYKHLPVG